MAPTEDLDNSMHEAIPTGLRGPAAWLTSLSVLMAAGLLAAGCGEPTIKPKEAEAYVEKWADNAAETLVKEAQHQEQIGPEALLETRLQDAAAKQEGEARRWQPPWDILARDVYQQREWALDLAGTDGLSPRGHAVIAALEEVESHAIDPEPFELDEVKGLSKSLENTAEKVSDASAYEVSAAEKAAAKAWLVDQKRKDFELKPENFVDVTHAVLQSDAGGSMSKQTELLTDLAKKRAKKRAELEHELARRALRYSRKLKHFRVSEIFVHQREDDYWSLPHTEGERPDEAKGEYVGGQVWRKAARIANQTSNTRETAILHERMRQTLTDLLEAEDRQAADAVLENLSPQHPDYDGLRAEYQRYKKIVADGGWDPIPPEFMRRGSTGPAVTALKERLHAEDYYKKEPPFDATFGADLEAAVENYQRHHQIRVTGSTYGTFRSSLNKPAKWRAQQLALNLKRWRESNVDHGDELYLMVNIPEYTVEIWKQGSRKMHFPIVVGNTRSKTNKKTGETEHPNHTPELSAYVDRVIYNPYWNITDRIRREEILPKARKSLEEKYLTKLRTMREKVQEHEQKQEKKPFFKRMFDGKSDDQSSGASNDDQARKQQGDDETYLVAQAGERPDDVPEDSQAAVSPPSNMADDASGDESTDGQNKKDKNGEKAKEPEVDISDLYRKGKEDFLEQKVIVFDVDKIRELISTYRAIESGGSADKKAAKKADKNAAPKPTPPSADKQGKEGEKSSPLKQTLPYLDPKTGKVDVSETDPDNIPEWYEENDYKVMYPGQKWEYVRQKQGDDNALGRVKVIFPNPHSVYLHDTPKKDLFSRTLRAFSHGCMRMEKPMEMAEFLLRETGQFDDINVPQLMRGRKKMVKDEETGEKKEETVYTYKPVFLKEKIPVHVEYFTVRPSEEGRAVFFADVYKKDLKAIKGEDAVEDSDG